MKLGDTALTSSVRTQLKSLSSFDFQDIVVKILFKRHGPEGFLDLREVRDKGSDGAILNEGCAIACYGPEENTKKKFEKKVREDHDKFALNWKKQYPKFRVYVNHDPKPDEVIYTKSFGTYVEEPWGIERLMEVISQLPWGSQIYIFNCLNIQSELIGRDFIRLILEDLTNAQNIKSGNLESKNRAPNIQKKIEINISESERDGFDRLLSLTAESQLDVADSLRAFDNLEIDMAKSRIVRDYDNTPVTESFIQRYKRMQQRMNDKYNSGDCDEMAHYIDAILGYMFCQCLIGKEPKR
ncbi:hypothetical protein [Undibacterium sp. Tian12W]|uniref:hypothetical protein n=1 Tax=Undibacterium sp. Tian12W TaxID=3413054 RepID=UPI003BF2BFEC